METGRKGDYAESVGGGGPIRFVLCALTGGGGGCRRAVAALTQRGADRGASPLRGGATHGQRRRARVIEGHTQQ
jgi:hypothetical protein